MKPIAAFRQVEHEGLGTLAEIFAAAGFECRYYDMFAAPPTRFDPAEHSGLVVLGGPMNVDETNRYPHLALQRQFIQQALDAELPVLGICLGAQLLASTLGAEVRPRPTKEIGWYTVDTSAAAADDRLFRHLGSQPTVFQWHGDGFTLPAGAVSLASSPLCPQQAFRYGQSAYALQFHLEVTETMVERWLTEPGNCAEVSGLSYINAEEIRHRLPDELPPMHALGRKLFAEFATLCQPHA
ncbi:MAG: gamma-glutamyl-gamma-aminobutyrate hydrolase family protein [Planctomycetia bacterium]|nr:gamma-glutamyl-gamma-aminobutyrate hydrolase family protein [Planctomycetia bacterium]